jgi:hypothetical protein
VHRVHDPIAADQHDRDADQERDQKGHVILLWLLPLRWEGNARKTGLVARTLVASRQNSSEPVPRSGHPATPPIVLRRTLGAQRTLPLKHFSIS